MPYWLPVALAFQILLTFLVPAISIGKRSLFPGDVWCFFWVSAAYAETFLRLRWKQNRSLYLQTGVAFAIFAVVCWHGQFRPLIYRDMGAVGLDQIGPDQFDPTRESIVALRFFSWFCALRIVEFWFSRGARNPRFDVYLDAAGILCLAASSAAMVVTRISPMAFESLGSLYGYSTLHSQWTGRMCGTFRSPVEAGTALVTLSILLAVRLKSSRYLNRTFRWSLGILALFGAILSHTMTPFLGAGLAFLGGGWARLRGRTRVILAVVVPLTFFALCYGFTPFLTTKWGDLLYRLGPWKVVILSSFKYWDLFIFGMGFTEYHIDNSYLFFFNRGGILLFGAFLYCIGSWRKANWANWNGIQRSLIYYFLLVALVLDFMIFRSTIALGAALAVPYLASVKGKTQR